MTRSGSDASIDAAATLALEWIPDRARVGIGSGRAVSAFVAKLGIRVREGLRVEVVPASRASAAQARECGIPVVHLGEALLDLTVDGADEVAPNLDLVKGWGGALVRERIVAAASHRQVILVSPDKLVSALGEHGRLPVEVLPLARWIVTRELVTLGLVPTLRMNASDGPPMLTENGNLILDCALARPLVDGVTARDLERALLAIVGVVDTGLFLGTAECVLVGHPDGHVDTLFGPETPRS